MANDVKTQVLVDGARNVVVKFEGVLDTSDLASTVVVDPANLQGIDNTGALKAKKLRIIRIKHNIEDGLSVNLFWDGAAPSRIEELNGRANPDFEDFGGLLNDAGTPNGKITATTQGWSAGALLSFSVILEMVKTQ